MFVAMRQQEELQKQGQANSATSLVDMFELGKLKWAGKDTKMSLWNVRLHLRILRRVSLAVANEAAPSYHESAL